MYLSRVELDPTRRSTMTALAAPQKFHGAVESAFSGERRRRLWRLDRLGEKLYLLLLSFSVDGFCQRMFTLFFQLICHFQKFSFGYLCCRNQIRHFRLSACDRSCLIQRNNLYFSCLF